MSNLLLVVAGVLLAVAALYSIYLVLARRASGVGGTVIYQDTVRADDDSSLQRPLESPRYGLRGQPDYLVREGGAIIPIEVKTGRTPRQPYDSHLIQLYAYCLLVEEEYGQPPPHGILRYPAQTFTLLYGDEEREWVLAVLAELRADREADDVPPNHDQPVRCRTCEYLPVCGQDRLKDEAAA